MYFGACGCFVGWFSGLYAEGLWFLVGIKGYVIILLSFIFIGVDWVFGLYMSSGTSFMALSRAGLR